MIRKYLLAAINICLFILLSVVLLIGVIKIDLLETNAFVLLCVFLSIFIGISLFCYFSKNVKVYNVGVFLIFLLNIILIYNVVDLNMKYDYIIDMFKNDNRYVSYHIYVQRKTTMYDQISKLDGRKIGVLKESFGYVTNNLHEDVNVEFITYDDIFAVEEAIYSGEIQSFVLTEDELQKINGENVDIMKKVRVIYTNKYKDTI